MTPTGHAIKAELYKVVEELGAKPRTTRTEEQVLECLRTYNETGEINP
jgi:hypothetical protein